MNNKGQTTVFFSLVISILFLFTMTVLEAGRINLGAVKIKPCIHSMRSSIMADYNEEMFERYHLLYMDPTYGTGSEAVVEEKIMDYLENSLNGEHGNPIYQFTLEEIAIAKKESILDDDMKMLKQQIADYEKTAGMIRQVQELAGKWTNKGSDVEKAARETEINGKKLDISGGKETKAAGELGENSGSGSKQQSASDSKIKDTKVKIEDPRDILSKMLKTGVLEFVLQNRAISKEKKNLKNVPSQIYADTKGKERDHQFNDINFLNSFLKESAEEDTSNIILEHAAFASYVTAHFSNGVNGINDSAMQCEAEYIIAGKDNDYDNLEAVVNEIIWLRMPVNYAYLLTDVEKKSEALTVASSICIATGTEPFIEVVKYLLLGCWAYGESLYEMRALLSGDNIAYVKTKENWYTDLKTLTAVKKEKTQTDGISYEEYLMILLAKKCGTSLNTGYARILDVVEMNVQKENPSFRITDCVGAMTIQGKISINPLFQKSEDETVYDHYFEESFTYE